MKNNINQYYNNQKITNINNNNIKQSQYYNGYKIK